MVQDGSSTEENHDDGNGADHKLSKRADPRYACHRRRNVAEQSVGTAREHQPFSALGPVCLHDANAAQRLGEPAGDLGVQLATIAKQRAQSRERERHAATE